MDFLGQCCVSIAIMGLATWASNIWPGLHSLWRAALSRMAWWALPITLIVWRCGASLDHASWVGGAAWLGAFMPHTELPDIRTHWSTMLSDLAITVLRVTAMLLLPGAVFYLCGAEWFALVAAAASAPACVLAANILPGFGIGLRQGRQVAGVLFGLQFGFWLVVAVMTPLASPDNLP